MFRSPPLATSRPVGTVIGQSKPASVGGMKSSHFEWRRSSPVVFSNPFQVAGDHRWRMSSRWRRFSRSNSYMLQVGPSGGLPRSWTSTGARSRDTYNRRRRTQNQPFRPPAPASQMQPLFCCCRLPCSGERMVAAAPVAQRVQMQPFRPPGFRNATARRRLELHRSARPTEPVRAAPRVDSRQAGPATLGPAHLAGLHGRSGLHRKLRQREAVRAPSGRHDTAPVSSHGVWAWRGGPGRFRQRSTDRRADGKRRKTHVFRIVLSHSRKAYSEATFTQTTEDFFRAWKTPSRTSAASPRRW